MGLADHMTEQSPDIGRPNIDVSAAFAEAAAEVPLLRIEGVSKNFGSFRAVDRLSLDVRAGEFFALLGAVGVSGAPGGDADEACAKAGIDAIRDKLDF